MKEIKFKSNHLNNLRKKAKSLSKEVIEDLKKPMPITNTNTFLSTYDTSSLKVWI